MVAVRSQGAYTGQPCGLRLTLNGKQFFAGPSPFPEGSWTTQSFTIPDRLVERYNKLAVQLMDDSSGHRGPPYLLVNYVVVKPARR